MSAPGSGEGAAVMAEALQKYGCDYAFGVVGIPIIELGMAIQAQGIRYIGTRNEQAAGYAAGAVGYLTGKPGMCLCVSGPGVVHGCAGLANAMENCWPMIMVGGASDAAQDSMMAFQEAQQLRFVRPYVKYAARIDRVDRIPFFVEKAIRMSVSGRPGPVYLDLPGNLVNTAPSPNIDWPLSRAFPPPVSYPDPVDLDRAADALLKAKRPLIIVGKGCNYARAEREVLELVEDTGIPFLPTPMGKGCISDDHPQCVIAARSTALKGADVVVLLCARLNWILHFGAPPRFDKNVKFIQVDVLPEAMSDNVPSFARLCGNAPQCVEQLNLVLKQKKHSPLKGSDPWWTTLAADVEKNIAKSVALLSDASVPMNYYHPISLCQQVLEKDFRDAIIISEGANTMDIGRTILDNYLPRSRIDAATYGSMGPALGQAIAAAVVHPDRKVVCLLGDSSFGFSGMEIETIQRYKLPIVIIIINNCGIAVGAPIAGETTAERADQGVPVTSLSGQDGDANYQMMAEAFGGKGYYITKPEEIQPALRKALAETTKTSILNIMISPFAGRKAQSFDWLSREEPKAKM